MEAKNSRAIVKERAYDRLAADTDTTEGQKKVLRMVKERDKNSKDIYQSTMIKCEEERVLMKDLKILERWREYYHKLKKQLWRMILQRSLMQILKWL